MQMSVSLGICANSEPNAHMKWLLGIGCGCPSVAMVELPVKAYTRQPQRRHWHDASRTRNRSFEPAAGDAAPWLLCVRNRTGEAGFRRQSAADRVRRNGTLQYDVVSMSPRSKALGR